MTAKGCAHFVGTLCLLTFCAGAGAGKTHSPSGFIDFNVYPYLSDVDSDNVITINAGAQLANRFSYFGFINFGNQAGRSELSDLDGYYTEQNIRWQVAEGSAFDATVQMNFRSGEDNDRHRLGVRWRLNDSSLMQDFFKSIYSSYSINWHVVQFDHEDTYVWQLEHVFNIKFPYISDRLALSGFADHTFNEDLPSGYPSNPVVAEAQLSYRLIENLHAVTEYRVNQYRRSDVNNLAVGLEYKVLW